MKGTSHDLNIETRVYAFSQVKIHGDNSSL